MSNDQIKLAQAELIQQVAEQNGIDVASMSDHELAKFAGYVLSQVEEPVENEKLAEAEAMGRHMARAYVDEQMKIAQVQEAYTVQEKVAGAMTDAAQYWAMKLAEDFAPISPELQGKADAAILANQRAYAAAHPEVKGLKASRGLGGTLAHYTGISDIGEGLKMRKAVRSVTGPLSEAETKNVAEWGSHANKRILRGAGKAGLAAAAVGGLGYGAYRLAGGGEKQAAYDLVKEAAEDLKSGDPTRMQQAAAKLKAAGGWVADKAKNYSGYDDIRAGLAGRAEAKDQLARLAAGEAVHAPGIGPVSEAGAKGYLAKSTWGRGAEEGFLHTPSVARGALKALGTAGALGAAGYGAYRLAGGGEKKASIAFLDSITPTDFAKLAEARAAEIMAYNGINPETLEACEPTAIKLAGVPMADEVGDWDEKVAANAFNGELNAAAMHILSNLGLVNG